MRIVLGSLPEYWFWLPFYKRGFRKKTFSIGVIPLMTKKQFRRNYDF